MDKLNDLKNWMKPRLKKLVRFINRLESRLVKQARQRERARGKQGQFGAPLGQEFRSMPELEFSDMRGPCSPNLTVRMGYRSARDPLDV